MGNKKQRQGMEETRWGPESLEILCLEPENANEKLRQEFIKVGSVAYLHCKNQEELLRIADEKPWQVVFTRLGLEMNAEVIAKIPSLLVIVTPTTGLDHIDQNAATAQGIAVLSLKGETEFLRTVTTTAEHSWSLLLTLTRRMNQTVPDVQAGNWRRAEFKAVELRGLVLGVLGFGRLGQIVAGYGEAFGMRMMAHDLRGESFDESEIPVEKVGLEELLKEADVLSVHLPLNPDTQYFLNRQRLSLMKPSSFLINTSRGEIIDEKALGEMIEKGHFAGVGLDVLRGDSSWAETGPELIPELVSLSKRTPRLIITPHLGGYAGRAIERTRLFMLKKLKQWIKGRLDSLGE